MKKSIIRFKRRKLPLPFPRRVQRSRIVDDAMASTRAKGRELVCQHGMQRIWPDGRVDAGGKFDREQEVAQHPILGFLYPRSPDLANSNFATFRSASDPASDISIQSAFRSTKGPSL